VANVRFASNQCPVILAAMKPDDERSPIGNGSGQVRYAISGLCAHWTLRHKGDGQQGIEEVFHGCAPFDPFTNVLKEQMPCLIPHL
jgi:hypothetical protein